MTKEEHYVKETYLAFTKEVELIIDKKDNEIKELQEQLSALEDELDSLYDDNKSLKQDIDVLEQRLRLPTT